MRLGDRDHFRCPGCSSLLHRKMFSSHPAECANKTEPEHANKGESYATHADSEKKVHSFGINEVALDHLGISSQQFGHIKDASILNKNENQAIPLEHLFIKPFDQDIKYPCQYCNFQSPNKGTLKVHEKILHDIYEKDGTHHRKRKLPTKSIPKIFRTPQRKDNLATNLKPYSSDSVVCSVCGATFTKPQCLVRHTENKHRDVISFPCNECGKLFPWQSKNCSRHFSRVCSLCSKIFPDRSRLKDHMNLHSGLKPYQCEQHSLRFHTKKALSDHVYQHNISYKASIPCNECNRLFLRKYVSCLNHRKLPCDECKNLFVKKYDSCVRHQKGRIHPCSGCKRLFSKMYADCSKHTLVCENQCGFKTTKGKKNIEMAQPKLKM